MDNRLKYFDALRGIAIVCVIGIHSSASITPPFTNSALIFVLLYRQALNFAVPLFLTISGYFLYSKDVSNKVKYIDFLKKQIPRVYFPCIIWSLVYLSLDIYRGNSVKLEIFKVFTFQSAVPYYFVLLIIQYYILLPILKRMATIKGVIIAGAISAGSCIIIAYVRYHFLYDIPLVLYAGFAPTWILFFVLGLYIRAHGTESLLIKPIILTLVGLLLSVVESYCIFKKYGDFGNCVTAVKLSSFIYSFFIIIFLFSAAKTKVNFKLFIFLGKISFGIYLIHLFFLSIFDHLLKRVPLFSSIQILHQSLLILLTILSCSILILLAKKINDDFSSKYLGL